MKLILHHLLKDIRAQRWLLLLWALSLIVPIVLDWMVLQPDYDLAKRIETIRSSPFVMFVNVIAWTVLLARLIQSEPVTGSTSFWLTRPIPPRVYIPSKLIFILLFLLLPSLVPLLLDAIQFPPSPGVFEESLKNLVAVQIIVGLCVVWLSTYTPSLLHFAGTLCVGFLGTILFSLLTLSLRTPVHHNLPLGTSPSTTFDFDILFYGLLSSLIVQHWLRRTQLGFSLGIAAIAVTLAIQFYQSVTVATVPDRGRPVKLAHVNYDADWIKSLQWSPGMNNGQENSQATARLNLVGDNKNAQPLIQSVFATFQVPGESPTDISGDRTIADPFFLQRQQMRPLDVLREQLPDISVVSDNAAWNFQPPLHLFALDSDLKQKLQGKTGTLTLNLEGRITSLELKAKIPLDQPHFIAGASGGFIRVRPFDSSDPKQLAVWQVAWEMQQNMSSNDMIYLLVDPQNHSGRILNQRGNSSSYGTSFGNAHLVDSEVYLSMKGDEPLDRMVLYVYQITPGDYFENTLTAPNFTMNPK